VEWEANPLKSASGTQGIVKSDNLEIGRILHLKSEIKNLRLDKNVIQFEISDF